MQVRHRLSALALLLAAVTAATPTWAALVGEPSVQQIVNDALGEGCVDASTDNGAETFPAGTYKFTLLGMYTDSPGYIGWAPVGEAESFDYLIGHDGKGVIATQTVTIPVPFVIRYQNFGIYTWSSVIAENGDAYDHFRVFAMCGAAGSQVGAIEDVVSGGDFDHNDFVFSMEPATRQTYSFTYECLESGPGLAMGPGAARSIQLNFIPFPGPALASGTDVEVEVVENPDGCGTPTITVSGLSATIEWPSACFEPGENVQLCLRSDKPLDIASAGLYGSEDEFLCEPTGEAGDPIPQCGDESVQTIDCSAAAAARPVLFAPHHKLVPVEITGVTSTTGDPVTITVTGVTQDEGLDGNGDGNTCADAVIMGGQAWVRAERAGGGNGRVYVVSFTASDGQSTCVGSVTVGVPHNRRAVPVDDGQTTNSLGECPAPEPVVRLKVAGLDVGGRTRNPGIRYSLPVASRVSLGVYDVTGRRVATLAEGVQEAGDHQVTWDASRVSPGVYFCRLRANGRSASGTILIAR